MGGFWQRALKAGPSVCQCAITPEEAARRAGLQDRQGRSQPVLPELAKRKWGSEGGRGPRQQKGPQRSWSKRPPVLAFSGRAASVRLLDPVRCQRKRSDPRSGTELPSPPASLSRGRASKRRADRLSMPFRLLNQNQRIPLALPRPSPLSIAGPLLAVH